VKWDVLSGVSIGAVNAVTLSMFKPGKEKEAADYLV